MEKLALGRLTQNGHKQKNDNIVPMYLTSNLFITNTIKFEKTSKSEILYFILLN